uniref:Uncharacterized protein n=1 Tax=Amphimedon queenslandica TaxID=400682 RepID=A0A1X7SSV5_AMPQE
MSWIGSSLIAHIAREDRGRVVGVEDSLNIEPNKLKWYRITRLHQLGVPALFVDLSKNISAELMIATQTVGVNTNSYHTIVYIPTALFDKRRLNDTEVLVAQLDHFHNLLFYVSSSPHTKLILILPSIKRVRQSPVQCSWIRTFERVLLSRNSGITSASLVSVGETCGPWSDPLYDVIASNSLSSCCWYILDLTKKLYLYINSKEKEWKPAEDCPQDFDTVSSLKVKERQMEDWRESYTKYLSLQTQNVTVGHYLMFNSHYRWGAKAQANKMSYIADWYLSAMKYTQSNLTIFHDHLEQGFQNRLILYSQGRTAFVKVKSLNKRISHDQRFYMTFDYLLDHPEIHQIVMTDIRDTVFKSDPMRAMSMIGDYLFIDNDGPFYFRVSDLKWLKQMTEVCYEWSPFLEETLFMYGCFDNGFIGGSRQMMLSVLSHMIVLLNKADISSVCDQVTANIVAHGFFYESMYAGYPLTSGFMTGITGPQGVCIKHKPREIKRV